MSRVTSKLQITIPRAIARRHAIEPGAELRFEDAGEAIRLVPAGGRSRGDALSTEERLALFDEATARQKARNRRAGRRLPKDGAGRGWRREDLYERGVPR